ncbi:MAG: hypothetical protein GX638_15090, partial [Crenarchaeota archaeon]|nr:hypothetical protein [Thermoproteota archaeon]
MTKILKKELLLVSLLFGVFTMISNNFAEAKRNFTFDDAMKFESLRAPKISNDGKWFAYEASQDRGDITASINSTEDTVKFRFANGRNITFSNNSEWAAMVITPTQLENENAKSAKDKPNNSLKIINLINKKDRDYEDLQKFVFSEDSKWLAFTIKNDESNKPKLEKFKEKKLGSNLVLHHLNSGTDITINWVTEFVFDTNSRYIFYTVAEPKGKNDGVYCRDLTKEFAPELLITNKENTYFSNLAWNKTSNILAFLSADLNEKGKPNDCSLILWNLDGTRNN